MPEVNRLETGSLSCATLLCGMDLADQPMASILQIKEEPQDSEEKELQEEMQAGPPSM